MSFDFGLFRNLSTRLFQVLEYRELCRALRSDIPPRSFLEDLSLYTAENFADEQLRIRGYSEPEMLWGSSLWNGYKYQNLSSQLVRNLLRSKKPTRDHQKNAGAEHIKLVPRHQL